MFVVHGVLSPAQPPCTQGPPGAVCLPCILNISLTHLLLPPPTKSQLGMVMHQTEGNRLKQGGCNGFLGVVKESRTKIQRVDCDQCLMEKNTHKHKSIQNTTKT
jgi:hypothetical protein